MSMSINFKLVRSTQYYSPTEIGSRVPPTNKADTNRATPAEAGWGRRAHLLGLSSTLSTFDSPLYICGRRFLKREL